jgi:hypothetical protein
MIRGTGSLFLSGCFAIVVGTLMFRFWRLGERSFHAFRFTREAERWEEEEEIAVVRKHGSGIAVAGESGAFELSPWAMHIACVAIALLLAFLCMDQRTIELLRRFERNVTAATSSYCPEREVLKPSEDPNAPGCALIRRAYALGYAASLGDCEPKIIAQKRGVSICTLRQRDEPLMHYAWRLFDRFLVSAGAHASSAYADKLSREFDERIGRLDALESAELQILTTAPHASHHIFTNLPEPPHPAFGAETCADRYRWLSHRPGHGGQDEGTASRIFEHIFAQLLFESRYAPASGYCREYHVHWGSPNDVCKRLTADPEAVLDALGALPSIRAALERYRLGKKLEAIAVRQVPLEPSAFLSFDCYVEDDASPPERSSTPFSLDGVTLSAEQMRTKPAREGSRLYTDRYDAVAKLLVRGFHYGALLSEAGLERGDASGLERSLEQNDFLLTRLYGLESFDIYLEPGFLADRPDLLDVYPYQLHLRNYVATFRRQYELEKGRL